jgi:hypothetical protein
MTTIYTDSEAIDNARSNLLWWGVAPGVVAAADKARLIELLKQRQSRIIAADRTNTDGLVYAIIVALLRDLERP